MLSSAILVKMKNKRAILLMLSAFGLLLSSCQSQKMTTLTSQEAAIDSYIQKSHSGKDVYRVNGTNRVVLVLGEGNSVEAGDTVKVALKGMIFTSAPGSQFCQDTVTCKIGSGYLIAGLDNGLIGAVEGENSYIIFNAQYGFYDKGVGVVPAMSALCYDTTVLEVKKAKK